MALGTAHQTVTTGANFVPEIWSQETQVATESNLVAAKRVKRFDTDVRQKGDVIHVPKVSNLAATAKVAETVLAFSGPTEDKVDITINKHFYISFLLEDILDAQSAYNTSEEYKGKISYGLAKQVDSDVLGLYTSITQTVGTAATPPGDPQYLRAIQYLDDADAPMEDRSLIMSPSLKATLLGIDKFVDQDFVGDRPVVNGIFGQRYGVSLFVSTNVPLSSGNPINQMFHKEAYALAMQRDLKVESQRILEYLGTLTVGQVLYGVAAYRTAFGVQFLS